MALSNSSMREVMLESLISRDFTLVVKAVSGCVYLYVILSIQVCNDLGRFTRFNAELHVGKSTQPHHCHFTTVCQ